MRKFVKCLILILPMSPKVSKFWQVDKTHSFENEESCRLLKEHFGNGSLSFKPVSKNDIISTIKKLPSNKASISNDMPVSVIKQFANCYCEKHFEQLTQRKQISKFNERFWNETSFLKAWEYPQWQFLTYKYVI